jgi:hypothetical protein
MYSELHAPTAISQASSPRVQLERAVPCGHSIPAMFPLYRWWTMSRHASAMDGRTPAISGQQYAQIACVEANPVATLASFSPLSSIAFQL